MNKKAIAILGAIFLLIIGTVVFLVVQKKGASKNTNTEPLNNAVNNEPVNNTPPVDNTPPANNGDNGGTFNNGGGAVKLTDDNVVSPVLFFQGNGVTYFNAQGQLFQSDLQVGTSGMVLANKRELTLPLKPNITKIIWPQTGNNFIAQIESGSGKTWSVYVSERSEYVDLPNKISAINWMPGGDKIMYVWTSEGKSSFVIANPDATGFQKVSDLFQPDNEFQISPDGKTILFYHTQTQGAVNKIYLTTPDGKLFKDAVAEGFNTGVLWGPDSRKFLFTRKDPASGSSQLWLGDFVTGETKNLQLNTTIDKVVWSPDGQTIVAAVPKSGGADQDDAISKLNINNLAKTDFETKIAVTAKDLFLSSSGDKVFFKNTQDGGLYYLVLAQ